MSSALLSREIFDQSGKNPVTEYLSGL